jgi:hypothetical protein
MLELVQAWIADVSSFGLVQIRLPGGGGDCGVAARADGIDGAIFVHPMCKLGCNEKQRLHENPGDLSQYLEFSSEIARM